tara:strand:- start:180 stop:356 length:177 start_codon:yes stop_codon:yes gene_type:complete
MAIKITEPMFKTMKKSLYFKDSISKHELVSALSKITYNAACMETDTETEDINPKWRKR